MVTQAEPLTRQAKSGLIAPWWHFLGMLVILLAFVWCTFGWQSHSLAAGEPHQGNALHYLLIIASEWAMALYIWLGGFIPGATRLRDLIGGRWNSRGQFFRDIAIAAVFWVVFVAAAYLAAFVLKPRQVGNLEFVNPLGAIEVTLWVIMSMTAGFCEELVFRGYLQKQFLAFTGRATLAVLAQAILFGVVHWYQGIKMVILISVLGLLYGTLAQWRKSLRPGIISHAWSDIVNVILLPFK
jgi:hypothetical protein